jgi:hypothetical protein
MIRTLFVFAVLCASASSATAQDFYGGLALGHLATETDAGVEGSATTVVLTFGARFDVSTAIFGEVEAGVFSANGNNDAGTEFENGFQVSAGLGTYFTDEVFGALHLGYVELSSSDPGAGDLTDAGPFATVRLGYDLTPQDTVALSVSHYETSNAVTDGSGLGVQLGYIRRF